MRTNSNTRGSVNGSTHGNIVVNQATQKQAEIAPLRQFPEAGFLRLKQIIGDPKKGFPPIIPVSASTWYLGVKTGRFPKGLRPMGGRVTFWAVEDVRALVKSLGISGSSADMK
jgi:hypothetical protein